MLMTLLVPVIITPVPPLTDYPNHLARCYLLAFGDSDQALGQMFSRQWQIIPNVAIDLILPRLMHVFSPLTAGRIMLVFCLLIPTSGAIALNHAYFRRRSLWQIASGFAAYNALFLMGFMNFAIGIGVAMWGAAAWVRYRESHSWASVLFAAFLSPVLFFFHLFGLCFYALLVGSYEFFITFVRWSSKGVNIRFALHRVIMFAVTMIVPLILYLLSPIEKLSLDPVWPSFSRKIYFAFGWILEYSRLFDLFVAASLVAFLVFCVMNGRAFISKAGLVAATALCCVYLVTPFAFKGVYFVDTRLPVMLGFMIFAAFLPRGLTSNQRYVALAFFAVLLVTRISFVSRVWVESQRDLDDVRSVVQAVRVGSRVLVADVTGSDNPGWYESMPISRRIPEVAPTYWHLASFVLLDRRAFWPNIFADASQQPIAVKEPYRELQAVRSALPNYVDLTRRQFAEDELEHFPFLAEWQQKFDFVLLLNAEGVPNLSQFLPDRLRVVDSRGIAALFEVRKADRSGHDTFIQ